MENEKSIFLVPWIEVEYGWGSRPEGYKVFENLENCIIETRKDSESGNYDGGYLGPERPLCYYEAPYDKALIEEIWAKELPKFHTSQRRI
jgi:hypothetical protein